MIQRKQTLFLFQLIFFGIALLFISSNTITTNSGTVEVSLTPITNAQLSSTTGHVAAIAINFIGLILTFATIFLYKKRELQVKLCYGLMLLWLTLSLMIAFCPFVKTNTNISNIQINYFACVMGAFAIFAAYMALRFIKKDIELLKSADRIR